MSKPARRVITIERLILETASKILVHFFISRVLYTRCSLVAELLRASYVGERLPGSAIPKNAAGPERDKGMKLIHALRVLSSTPKLIDLRESWRNFSYDENGGSYATHSTRD